MNFNESLGRSIAFSSGLSVNQLVSLPHSRFKGYVRKVQKDYYTAKARFERSNIDDENHNELLFAYELAYSHYFDMKIASKKRKSKQ